MLALAAQNAYERYEVTSVDRTEVLRYLGYSGQPMAEELDARVDGVVARCLEVARPAGVWRVFEVAGREPAEDGRPSVQLKGAKLELIGDSMREHMEGAAAVAVMAVTAGMTVEQELRRLSLTDTVEQCIFDAAGTTTVERAADACEASIVAAAHTAGLFTNFRFSPGYGDMPLDTQPVLLAALDAQRKLGITLSKSLLMTPTKSVTAVIGLFEEPQPTSHASCKDCLCAGFCRIRAAGRPCWA
ncbi:vitamin B12 dependent-methionine synthase activation domain-containing protein [Paratractidigestivibacter sp.]|uniref:vitamin B12 dependent-methionine synthase activation domain-containing protein n=1 Tax=Paratractidigestivibacter sp. TaxID=2847316 RepID=UPI002ABDB6FF|nr:vitamin B12 dependent-methionine synthase activation domain-containing protein [Paratractidigestivibacter sp.]